MGGDFGYEVLERRTVLAVADRVIGIPFALMKYRTAFDGLPRNLIGTCRGDAVGFAGRLQSIECTCEAFELDDDIASFGR